jgi:phenylalanyl-tRNA synthetase beta chain
MAAAIEWNLNHGQRNVRLFEIGSHYRLNGSQSVETRILTIGATGESREKGIYDSASAYSVADLKGDLDAIGSLAGGLVWKDGGESWLHAARSGSVLLGDTEIGTAGQLARPVAERQKLRQDVFLGELRLDPMYAAIAALKDARRYQPLPRFPAVERDFSLLLADGTHFSDVSDAIRSLNIPEIASVEATDLFRGKNVPAGKYSLLVRVTFQSRESTLTDAQTSDFSVRIVAILERQLGAQLRAS